MSVTGTPSMIHAFVGCCAPFALCWPAVLILKPPTFTPIHVDVGTVRQQHLSPFPVVV